MSKYRQFLKKCLSMSFMWLIILPTILYPGHNPQQTRVIKPSSALELPTTPLLLYPTSDGTKAPSLSAKAALVQDPESRVILIEKNSDVAMPAASTTKLMTALVTLDLFPDLEQILEVSVEDRTLGQTMELVKGERLSVKALLAGLLIRSGNDAALALANSAPGGYSGFISAMNQKAKDLGLTHTHYQNPSGLDQYNHQTTARDLAILIAEVADHDVLVDYMLQANSIVTDETGEIIHSLQTTNQLLGSLYGLKAAKTGYTYNAGECFVTYIARGDNHIVTVVLGSSDRFGETNRLVDWAYQHHIWIVPPEI